MVDEGQESLGAISAEPAPPTYRAAAPAAAGTRTSNPTRIQSTAPGVDVAIPRGIGNLRTRPGEPKPTESPMPNPVWPLWFAPHAFLLTRRAGGLLILGMIAGAIVGW